MTAQMSVGAALQFWDQRHRTRDDLTSGGDVSFDRPSNEHFYSLRLGLLLQVLGDATSGSEPRYLLDAGCGKGWFSRNLARCGYRVVGVDASEEAIRYCRSLSDRESYEVSTIADWIGCGLYDVAVAVDVLFHLLDDVDWERSLVNIAAHVRTAGRLVVADWDRDEDRRFGTHQRCRPPSRYRGIVDARGFRYDGFMPYQFRGSRVGFHSWTRVS